MQYKHANKSVKERKEYGEHLRSTILNLLPATINEIAKIAGRSRTSINHHLRIMGNAISRDASKQPHVYLAKDRH